MDTYLQYSQMRFIYIQCVLLQFLRNGSTRCSTRSVTCTKNLSTFSYWHFLSNLLARQYCTAPLIFCLRIADSRYIVPTTSQKIKMPTKGTETCSFPHWWAWQPEIAAKKLWPFEFRFHLFFGVVLEADQGLPPFFRHQGVRYCLWNQWRHSKPWCLAQHSGFACANMMTDLVWITLVSFLIVYTHMFPCHCPSFQKNLKRQSMNKKHHS